MNRAIGLGIEVREAESEDDLKAWYTLYLETMRRVIVPARPYRFFQGLWRSLRPRGLMSMLIAERPSCGRPGLLAGSILLKFGQSVHYAFTGCRTESLKLHVNDLIQWEGIQRANREGFRYYDFGEVAEERQGLADFKSKWCARPILLYRYQYPEEVEEAGDVRALDASLRLLKKLWPQVPLRWTEYLSEQLFCHL